nr:hypothetical protein Iba_scaffold28608CG0010 [Ipomoea batatas]
MHIEAVSRQENENGNNHGDCGNGEANAPSYCRRRLRADPPRRPARMGYSHPGLVKSSGAAMRGKKSLFCGRFFPVATPSPLMSTLPDPVNVGVGDDSGFKYYGETNGLNVDIHRAEGNYLMASSHRQLRIIEAD